MLASTQRAIPGRLSWLILVAGIVLGAGCAVQEVTILSEPPTAHVNLGQPQFLTAVITGTNEKVVEWFVCDGTGANCVAGGNSTVGTIVSTGFDFQGNPRAQYTAPASLPSPPACLSTSDGCAVAVKGQLVAFDVACFSTLTITGAGNPVPVITSLSPNTTTVNSGVFSEGDLDVFGSGFIASSVVRWDGSARTTTFISDTHLSANIRDSDIAVAGTFDVTVLNPSPGGGTSNTAVLNINNPAPAITLLTPSSATEGGAAFTLTVDGTGFVSSSVVQWNGSARITTFLSTTQLEAAIPASDIATAGTANVTVFNPAPGGGTSNALTFTINPPALCSPGVLERVSVSTAGTEGNGSSQAVGVPPATSADGRFVTFQSNATNLVTGDTNGFSDIFVRDTCRGAPVGCTPSTVRVSVASDGTEANEQSAFPRISATGRFVVFLSRASNLVPTDTNGTVGDIFLHDRDTDDDGIFDEAGFIATTLASVSTGGAQGSFEVTSANWDISANGRFVVFGSAAQQYTGDTDFFNDVFVRDTCFGAGGCTPSTVKVSVDSSGVPGNASSPSLGNDTVSISATGRFVVFGSAATNLVTGDTNGIPDIFLHDRDTDGDGIFDEAGAISTTRVSLAFDGSEANVAGAGLGPQRPFISANGRVIAFASDSSNLVPSDSNGGFFDVFLRDTCFGAVGCTPTTILASIDTTGSQAVGFNPSLSATGRIVAFQSGAAGGGALVRDTCLGATGCTPSTVRVDQLTDGTPGTSGPLVPALSADARFAAFPSPATNLVTGDTNSVTDVFLAQTCFTPSLPLGVVARVSVASDGSEATSDSRNPTLTPDGRFVAFQSDASNLVPVDTNAATDVFLHDRDADEDALLDETGVGETATVRVSVASDGTQGNGQSLFSAISADGRFVAFASVANNLVTGDTDSFTNIFVRDTCRGAPGGCTPSTVQVSVASNGTPENGSSGGFGVAISATGRFVAFESDSSNLVSGDTGFLADIFVHDRDADNNGIFDETCAGCRKTVRVSVASDGTQGNSHSVDPAISADGRFVAFNSEANNLVGGDSNVNPDVFVHDRDADENGIFDETGAGQRATVRVSVASDGTQAVGGPSRRSSVTPDGRFVTLDSLATNLVTGDTNGTDDIFVHDRDADEDGIFDETGAGERSTVRVSVASDGSEGNDFSRLASISADGRLVAFLSAATNLVSGDTNGVLDIFVHDRDADTDGILDEAGAIATVRVSVDSDGAQANNHSLELAISADHRWVAFGSFATNLVSGDTNGFADIFVAGTGIP